MITNNKKTYQQNRLEVRTQFKKIFEPKASQQIKFGLEVAGKFVIKNDDQLQLVFALCRHNPKARVKEALAWLFTQKRKKPTVSLLSWKINDLRVRSNIHKSATVG